MPNILIVSETKSYFPLSLQKRLTHAGYSVSMIPADTDAVLELKDPFTGILVYVDEQLLEQPEALNSMKERAIADDSLVFIIGDEEGLKRIRAHIPYHIIHQEFPRPINLNTLASFVDRAITQAKKRILVVDDSGAALRNVKGWLGDKYSVTLANSGAMAIKAMSLNLPDLVLLDYAMPICDGKQVLEMIRAEPDFAHVPVMFFTNKSDRESIMRVQELNPAGYLLKSMEPSQIISAVDGFFEKRKTPLQS